MRAAGYQAWLISPDPYDFIYLSVAKDLDSQRAYFLSRQEHRIKLQAIAQLNIQVTDWQVSQPLLPLIRSSLGHLCGREEVRTFYGA